MSVQSFWTGAATFGATSSGKPQDRKLSQEVFIIIFVAIIIGWIIIALWTRALDNFTYSKLKMNRNSTWDTVLIAIAVTIFFIAIVWVIDTYDVVQGGLGKEFVGEDDPVFGRVLQEEEADMLSGGTLLGGAFTGPNNASIPTLFPGLVFGGG